MQNCHNVYHADPRRSQTIIPMIVVLSDITSDFRHEVGHFFGEQFPSFMQFQFNRTEVPMINATGSKMVLHQTCVNVILAK